MARGPAREARPATAQGPHLRPGWALPSPGFVFSFAKREATEPMTSVQCVLGEGDMRGGTGEHQAGVRPRPAQSGGPGGGWKAGKDLGSA